MEVERNIILEREPDEQSATDRQSAFTTFLVAANAMPRFTEEELRLGKKQIDTAYREIQANFAEADAQIRDSDADAASDPE